MNMLIMLLSIVYYHLLFELYKRTRREEDLYTVRNYIQTRQISVYLCIIYGIVIIEIYSCNKDLYTYKVA